MKYTLVKKSKFYSGVIKEADSLDQIFKYKVAAEMMEDNQDGQPMVHKFHIMIDINDAFKYVDASLYDDKEKPLVLTKDMEVKLTPEGVDVKAAS
jgi:hypothetical protein